MTATTLWPWQKPDWAHLQAYSEQGRIPQALLMIGKNGLGKHTLANHYAHSLLCAAPNDNGFACGVCQQCLLLKAGSHPDFITIKPEESGKAITVDSIRSLLGKLTLKPQFDRYRVVIINPAEAMNTNASNAFLKCLEEPVERTVIILVSESTRTLPATIASRCQKILLAAPNQSELSTWLQQQAPTCPPESIQVAMNLAQQAPLLALSYSNDGTLASRQACFNEWLAIAKHRSHPVTVAENWQKLSSPTVIFWLQSWFADMVKYHYQLQPHLLYNPDLKADLQALAQKLDLKRLYQWYDLLLASRQRQDTTVNKQCMMEEILIQWHELNLNSY